MLAFLSHATKQKIKLQWLSSMANDIIDIYVLEQSQSIPDIYDDTDYMESQLESLQSTDEDQIKCPNCQKSYQQFHWLRRHMKAKHGVVINLAPPQNPSGGATTPYQVSFVDVENAGICQSNTIKKRSICIYVEHVL